MMDKIAFRQLWLRHSNTLLYVCIFVWIIIQVFLIFHHWDFELHDDAFGYRRFAETCYQNDTFYPSKLNATDPWIAAPGYVNILILCKSLTGSYLSINFLNLFANIAILYFLYFIAQKLFSKDIAIIASILFMATFSNIYAVITPMSDLIYLFFCMLSLYVVIKKDSAITMLLAGISLGIGNWIRPLAIAFLITLLVYMFFYKYKKISMLYLVISYIAINLLIGYCNYKRTGYWMSAAQTSGVNMARVVHHDNSFLNNTIMNHAFQEDPYYKHALSIKDAIERDKELRKRAINLVLENPAKYILSMPLRFIMLHVVDNWSERVLPNKGAGTVLLQIKNHINQKNYIEVSYMILDLILKSLVYYLIIFFVCAYLYTKRRTLLTNKKNILLLIPVLNIGAIVLFSVIDRYHYPYMPILTLYASVYLYKKFNLETTLHSL